MQDIYNYLYIVNTDNEFLLTEQLINIHDFTYIEKVFSGVCEINPSRTLVMSILKDI